MAAPVEPKTDLVKGPSGSQPAEERRPPFGGDHTGSGPDRSALQAGPELTIVVPTLDEHDNVAPLIERLENALRGISWEAIFVDDDSTDGTIELLRRIARRDARIRCLHRIGRRGLSSACLEGMAASTAPYLAVIDADLQHDEALLPRMLVLLKGGEADLVVGSRYMEGGGTGEWSRARKWISRFATRLGQIVLRTHLSDPMSGFFMLSRGLFDRSAHRVSGKGFKILLDLVASARGPVRCRELPYTFRQRHAGVSKLDTLIAYEFVLLLYEKLIGWLVPVGFVMFATVGLVGAFLHLGILGLLLKGLGASFVVGQATATWAAMTLNFTLNNQINKIRKN